MRLPGKLLLTVIGLTSLFAIFAMTLPTSSDCPAPSARSVISLFAPCLTQEAMGEKNDRTEIR